MILEVAEFGISDPADCEAAMAELVPVISASPGYLGHTIQRCIETLGRYLALIRWNWVEAHKSDSGRAWHSTPRGRVWDRIVTASSPWTEKRCCRMSGDPVRTVGR